MRKMSIIIVLVIMVVLLAFCGTKASNGEMKTEIIPVDYGDAVVLAQDEFNRTFSEFDEIEITETSTMVRMSDTNRLVVQFTYSSSNGIGVYGFEIEKTSTGSYEIVQQGENVTIDNLLEEN